MASDIRIEVDSRSVMNAINRMPGLEDALYEYSEHIAERANAISAGYRTGRWHDHLTGETLGGTPTMYGADVFNGRKGYIGIVHPENYSAMKDNHLHNTMLKAKG